MVAMEGTSSGESQGRAAPIVDWDLLPEDLLARILARLPFSSLVRSRCVCKRWKDLNLSGNFTHTGNLASKCVPIYFFEGPLKVYNSGSQAWEEQSLEFLGLPLNSLALLVSAGGLLCFKNRVSGDFVVCNPITKRWRSVELPSGFAHNALTPPVYDTGARSVPEPETSLGINCKDVRSEELVAAYYRTFGREVIVGMLTEKYEKNFKLLVAGVSDGSQRRVTLIYDSLTDCWRKGGEVPRETRFWESGKTIYFKGVFYCVTWRNGSPDSDGGLASQWSVARYNVKEDGWSEYPLNLLGSKLPQLVEHRGRGFLVQKRFINARSAMFFEELKESETMSTFMCMDWPSYPYKANVPPMGDWCVGQGDCFYLAEAQVEGKNALSVLACDLTMRTWTRLPILHDKGRPSLTWLRTLEASMIAAV